MNEPAFDTDAFWRWNLYDKNECAINVFTTFKPAIVSPKFHDKSLWESGFFDIDYTFKYSFQQPKQTQ